MALHVNVNKFAEQTAGTSSSNAMHVVVDNAEDFIMNGGSSVFFFLGSIKWNLTDYPDGFSIDDMPTTRPDGSALEGGDVYFVSEEGKDTFLIYVYDGTTWKVDSASSFDALNYYMKSEVYNKAEIMSRTAVHVESKNSMGTTSTGTLAYNIGSVRRYINSNNSDTVFDGRYRSFIIDGYYTGTSGTSSTNIHNSIVKLLNEEYGYNLTKSSNTQGSVEAASPGDYFRIYLMNSSGTYSPFSVYYFNEASGLTFEFSCSTAFGSSDNTKVFFRNVESNKVNLIIDGNDTGKTLNDALQFASQNMVTQDELLFNKLQDVQIPEDKTKAYSMYYDSDGFVKLHALTKKGISAVEEERIVGGNTQHINMESGWHEIEFGNSAGETQGTQFSKSGNGILVNNIDNIFNVNAVVTANFSGVWLNYPITASIRLMKNGVDTGLFENHIVEEMGNTTFRLTSFTSDQITGLAAGDVLTLEMQAVDSSGFEGDGSWAEFSLSGARNFACYYRSLSLGGNYYNVEDMYGKFLVINKSDTDAIPSAQMTLMTFTESTVRNNSEQAVFSAIDNSFVFNTTSLATYDVNLTLNVDKTGSSGNIGLLKVMSLIEKYDEVSDTWSQYTDLNIGRMLTMANNGTSSRDYSGRVQFEEAGKYRIRFYWQDTGSGNLSNANVSESITLSTGETVTNSIETTVAFYESVIH